MFIIRTEKAMASGKLPKVRITHRHSPAPAPNTSLPRGVVEPLRAAREQELRLLQGRAAAAGIEAQPLLLQLALSLLREACHEALRVAQELRAVRHGELRRLRRRRGALAAAMRVDGPRQVPRLPRDVGR